MRDLAPERRDEARLVHRLMPHMAVEIAIGAFGQAERPVQVNAEARVARRMVDHRADVIRKPGADKARPRRGLTHGMGGSAQAASRNGSGDGPNAANGAS